MSLEEIILNARILARCMLGENRTSFSKPIEVKDVIETKMKTKILKVSWRTGNKQIYSAVSKKET